MRSISKKSVRKSKLVFRLWLKHDLPAGFTVFFVALPLCLGISLASGAPYQSGLLAGMVGGILVSLLSGSQLSVSGPAAGLSTVVAAAIISSGSFAGFLVSLVIAGLFQILLGLIKAGGLANLFPSAVIRGMLAAIGIILFSKQLPIALGYDMPDFWNSGFLSLFSSSHIISNFTDLNRHLSKATMVLTGISLLILIGFTAPKLKKLKFIPSALVAVLVVTLISLYLIPDAHRERIHRVTIQEGFFSGFIFPDWSVIMRPDIWKNGITIGILATLETLLCIEAIDKLDKQNRITPVNRELIAHGIGNTVCGLIGAIPITAVIVRGAANIDAGARSRFASFTHGILLMIAVILTPLLINKIPLAVLASILLITGIKLAPPKLFMQIYKTGFKQFLPFITTIILILMTDLLIGVGIGTLIAILFIIKNNYHQEFKVITDKRNETTHITIKLNSNVSFLNKVKLRSILGQVKSYSAVTFDASDSTQIDFDILEIIQEFQVNAHHRHIEVELLGISEKLRSE
ncbi:MAG: SulP family inorganic anion transporter [Bacteroidota bacterium]